MVLDCEFNQPSKRTIQIGAVMINNKGELLDTFETKVDPNELLSQMIVDLTRITQPMVDGAPRIFEAFTMLKEFHKRNKATRNPVVWGAGSSNDSLALYNEARGDGLNDEENFMGFRINDAKGIWQAWAMANNKEIAGGLSKVLEQKLKIGWDPRFGLPHDALADAWNTARAWAHMTKRLDLNTK
jgi:DNA polymerase III epsilon subunit-like protein